MSSKIFIKARLKNGFKLLTCNIGMGRKRDCGNQFHKQILGRVATLK